MFLNVLIMTNYFLFNKLIIILIV
ncbi:hypothetical protein Mgra_00010023 [Meloidogyne graminicola]|uniref:Uncharacterized protein n=1 Tax=Meloidogyne graminicola TaxID=189291 RepID=A0A8S9Z7W9_9BILA|nr:hypothetical protein Mgra_00010023 [Meloidogyne graminicola]